MYSWCGNVEIVGCTDLSTDGSSSNASTGAAETWRFSYNAGIIEFINMSNLMIVGGTLTI